MIRTPLVVVFSAYNKHAYGYTPSCDPPKPLQIGTSIMYGPYISLLCQPDASICVLNENEPKDAEIVKGKLANFGGKMNDPFELQQQTHVKIVCNQGAVCSRKIKIV